MSRFSFIRTIRGRITLLFAAVFGVVLIAFSLVLYHLYARDERAEFDDGLLILARSIATSISEKGSVDQDILQELTENSLPINFGDRQYVEIIDADAAIVVKSAQLGRATLPLSDPAIQKVVHGERSIETIQGNEQDSIWDQWGVRLLLHPATGSGGSHYVIAIGEPVEPLESSLFQLRLIFYSVIPLTLLIAGAAGWFLAKRAFDPVDRIITTAHSFTAEHLHQRLPVSDVDDELSRLSHTLNEMIGRLEKAFESQKQFSSNASHELRTPLTILKGEMEVTLERQRTPEEYEEVLRSNIEEVRRLQRIVDNLLLLSRVDSGKMPATIDAVPLDELLIEAVRKSRHIAQKKNIAVVLMLNHDAPGDNGELSVQGDHGELLNVLLTILDNAIKFTHNNGTVSCTLSMSDTRGIISITDNGPGISPDHLVHVFERFYRADPSRTNSKTGGTGLGLSIAKAVVEAHRGSISARSEMGKGTTIQVTLPL